MTNESFSDDRSPNPEGTSAPRLPITETEQPDPLLQMSAGRIGAGGITLAAAVMAIVLGVVLYGLNDRTPAESTAAPASTKTAQHAAAGGNSGAATPGAPRANHSGVKG